jgi:4-hydroxy-tetrahydrodipicolinate synthase
VLPVVPYYNKPGQGGIYAHFRSVAESVRLPIILYDVPSRTVCGLADETVARLAEIPQFVGLKDASGDLARPRRLRARLGPDFCLTSADDRTALAFMAQGGDGCILVTSNVAPGLWRDMYLALQRGHLAQAQRLAFRESNPAPVKYALSKLKIMSSRLGLPLVEIKQATKAEIDAILAELAERYTESLVEGALRRIRRCHTRNRCRTRAAGTGSLRARAW